MIKGKSRGGIGLSAMGDDTGETKRALHLGGQRLKS